MHARRRRLEGGGETDDLIGGLLQQVEGEPLRRLLADPGQAGNSVTSCLDALTPAQSPGPMGGVGSFFISACTSSAARRCASATAASDQIGQQLGITAGKGLGVDAHVTDVAAPIDRHAHKTAAGLDLEGPVGEFGLELLEATLPLLAELPHLLKVNHSHVHCHRPG